MLEIDEKIMVQKSHLRDIFTSIQKFKDLSDTDAVRLCFLVLLEVGFIGLQGAHSVSDELIRLVDD